MHKWTRSILTAVAATGVAAGVTVAGAAPAEAATINCVNLGSSFGSVMIPGQCIRNRANGRYVLIMQADGNLVLYDSAGAGRACWASGDRGRGFRAGDRALFSQKGISIFGTGDIQYGLAVGHYVFGPIFSATFRYDNDDFSVTDKTYNVSVNDKSEVYVGYQKIAGC